jgi:hypothetical protein
MTLAKLGVEIDRNDASGFVRLYIVCLMQGFLLRIPTAASTDTLREMWSTILAKYRRNFSDEFCDAVTLYWESLMGGIDPKSPSIEHDLCRAAGIDVSTIDVIHPLIPATPPDNPLLSKNEGFVSDISERYQAYRAIDAISIPDPEQLKSMRQKAFKSQDVPGFLGAHLSFAAHGELVAVPKSSVHASIRSQWETIIADLYHTIATDEFVHQLTNTWFYLVNQKGIPLSVPAIDAIRQLYAVNQRVNPSDAGGSGVAKWFKRWLGS